MAKTSFVEHRPLPRTVSEYVCIDFVNSLFADHIGGGDVYDRLELVVWRRWFVRRCGFADASSFNGSGRRRLTGLRSLIRRLLESGRPPDAAAVAELNVYLMEAQPVAQLSRVAGDVQLQIDWRQDRWRGVMAAIVVSYANVLAVGELDRIRTCANPNCTWMFYDESRNRSRIWCDTAACGNFVRARRHRARVAR